MNALKHQDARVRAGAADATRRMGAKASAVIPLLVERLKDRDSEVASNAALALGSCGSASRVAIPALIEFLKTDHTDSAIKALKQLRPLSEPALIDAIGDSDYLLSKRAALALWGETPERVSILIESMQSPDLRVRRGATSFLGAIRGIGTEAVSALLNALTEPDAKVRCYAAQSLIGRENHSDLVVSALTSVLGDESENVQVAVVQAIGTYGTAAEPAVPELIKLLDREAGPKIYREVAQALKTLGPVAVPALINTLREPDNKAGPRATEVLEEIGARGSAGIPALVEALKDENATVRSRASTCLAAIGSKTVPLLIELLGDPQQPFVEDAKEALHAVKRKLARQEEDLKIATLWAENLPSLEAHDENLNYAYFGNRAFADPTVRLGLDAKTKRELLEELNHTSGLQLEIDQALATSEEARARTSLDQPKPPPPRYTDIRFYGEDRFRGRIKELSADQPLQVKGWYEIEFAIRKSPVGDLVEGKREPLRETGKPHDVELLVTAESPDFIIEKAVQRLVLPPEGDSTAPAYFRVSPKRATVSVNKRSRIDFRVFYKFNLLAVTRSRVEVVEEGENAAISIFGSPNARTVEHVRLESDLSAVYDLLPREMHIDITRNDDNSFKFTFTYLKGLEGEKQDDDLVLTASIHLQEQALKGAVSNIRKTLLGIVMTGSYGEFVEGTDEIEFARQMNLIGRDGEALWTTLFKLDKNSPMYKIGEFLAENPLKPGSLIQVSTAPEASDLVFPWNLLYDKKIPDTVSEDVVPALDGFWGLRYIIEQRLPDTWAKDEPIVYDDDFEVTFMLWNFVQAKGQEDFLKELLAKDRGTLNTGESIKNAKVARRCLADCKSQILYFFTHGHTSIPASNIGGLTLADVKSLCSAIPNDSPQHAAWEARLEDLQQNQFASNDSWIELSVGRLSLMENLYREDVNLRNSPIVFLNMCESAQVTPDLSKPSFIHFFINRDARSVIGTECSITPLFADSFARSLFPSLMRGDQIGKILLDLRRDFMTKRNPLGLAYTLFGSATVRLEPSPVQDGVTGSEKEP
jgi:HEAT repeat protein